ncbi:anti-phage defense ZorAB system protein ZorA [Burkholderia anthina]|uniref:anti-phage ZorAB system protein ZorA n=1 Tax=Burkholderia anthina TaxID=179879 RepID=UPI001CF2EEB2|nr:anti-phage ZorAB system protein ZorA [Burkholderia anthina]MCA8095296.1 anti-phage defense ZorAB system protein ZorA [Burkholderia anthina]
MNLGEIASEYWHIGVVALVLAGLSLDFLVRFFIQSFKLRRDLDGAIAALQAIRGEKKAELVELSAVETKAMKSEALSNPWTEYAKTLHKQLGDEDELGQQRIRCWRSTALAETFFTDQAIVDSRLKTDFFKHLPGVLTGLGIIGTFLGLIKGLVHFDVSVDPAAAQAQLQGLVSSVGHAFYVSAFAIALAMLITWVEKTIVTGCYGQVEDIRELVDGMFRGGAGEEYLQQLAKSSQDAATQAQQMRDSLVVDLKEILTTLAERQIAAQAQYTGQMSVDVAKVISESLASPMSAMAEAVQKVSGSQGEAVNKLLTDVLASFSAQMQEMFGGQMRGMSDLLQKASESMQATAIQFGQLAASMDAAGTNTVDSMGEKLAQALDAMDVRQSAMNARMGEFVEQIRSLVAQSQSETGEKLREALAAVGTQVAGVVETLRKQAEEAAESQGQRAQRFEESTGQAINSLSGQVEQLLSQSVETNKSLQTSVSALAGATDRAMASLNSGVETLYVAASDFAKAGSGVSETMRSASTATDSIKTASAQLSMATDNAKEIFADYARTRDTFATMVADLRQTFESAKKDAAMTSELVGKIQAAARELAAAQQQSEDYLKGVTEVLVGAHESFRDNIDRTLGEGNRKFQSELSNAVNLLSGAIKNLGDAVDEIPAGRGR